MQKTAEQEKAPKEPKDLGIRKDLEVRSILQLTNSNLII